MTEMITRTVKVTIEKEVKVSFPASLATPEEIADWSRSLFQIEGADDIAKYTAEMAARGYTEMSHDGIGRLISPHAIRREGERFALYEELSDYTETEIIEIKEG